MKDETGFIYVSGSSQGMKYPNDVGKPITVIGAVRLKNGKPYIEVAKN